MTQVDLSSVSGISSAKLSRLLSSATRGGSADAKTLERLLLAFPDPEDQFSLVYAHLQDSLEEGAMSVIVVRSSAKGGKKTKKLDPSSLSPIGRDALDYLLRKGVSEDLFIDLARALGWSPK